MKRTLLASASLLLAASVFAIGANLSELIVTLKFVPQEGVASNTANLPPSMTGKSIEIRVKDARGATDPLVIGTGTGSKDKPFPIKASSDITPFLKETLSKVAGDWGMKPAAKADHVLVIDVNRFFIDESNKALGSVYTSEVKLGWTLHTSGGRKLAEGAASGSTHRYGRAHSVENINEVLSDALKEAFANVMNDASLQKAWK